jgi:hypothetical protein
MVDVPAAMATMLATGYMQQTQPKSPATAAASSAAVAAASDYENDDDSDDSDELCICCLEAPRSVMFMHGGSAHLCMCGGCASRYSWRSKGCPVCRQPLDDIVLLAE